MSNKKNAPVTAAQINEQIYLSAMGKQPTIAPIKRKDAYDLLMSAPENEMVDLNGGEYFSFEDAKAGDRWVFVVRGFTAWTSKNGQSVKAVQIEDFKDGSRYVCAAAVLHNACLKLTQLPCLIRVTYNGIEKTDKGRMFDLKIEAFPSLSVPPQPSGKNETDEDVATDDLPF